MVKLKSNGGVTMTIEELNKQIKSGRVMPIYFFYGDEQYLLNRRVSDIEKKIITPGMEDFNRFVFEGDKTDIEAVIEAAEQYPQMSDKKVVIVKNSGFFNQMNLRNYKRIKEFSLDLPDYTCLIFIEDNFDKKKVKNVDFLNDIGGVVAFDFLPVNRLEIWIEEKAKNAEKQLFPKDLSYFVKICGPSLGKLSIEFEKLLNYVGDKIKITREDIDAVVDKTAEYRIYDMIDNTIAGKAETARKQLKYLLECRDSIAPTVIIASMTGKLVEILTCKQLKETGMSAKDIGTYFDFNRPQFVVNRTIEESKRYSEKYLTEMIKKGLDYDFSIKTGKLDGIIAAELFMTEILTTRKV